MICKKLVASLCPSAGWRNWRALPLSNKVNESAGNVRVLAACLLQGKAWGRLLAHYPLADRPKKGNPASKSET